MKVTTEELPERQVKLQIEVDEERHANAIEAAYKKLAPRVRIPGFRPGKAPRPLIEKQIGRHRLLDEAIDILVPQVYREVLEEQDITPVGQPSVELVSHEPLVFTATIPLQPIVDLGDYRSLRLPREEVKVKDEQVEKAIEDLRRRYGTIEPVDRPAQKGDLIRGSVRAETEDSVIFSADDIEFRLTDASLTSLPGLADVIVGLNKGDEVTRAVDVPEDHESKSIAGKKVTYRVQVEEVKEEKLAPLNDDFAKEVGEGFETLLALRAHVRQEIEKAESEAALRQYELAVVDALVDRAKLEYPAVLVEHEIDHILEDQANLDPRDPRAQLLYLQRLNKTEQEVRDSVREEATRRLRRSLVLSEFAKAENISVEDSDVDAEIDSMAASAGEQAEAIRRLFANEAARESLARSLHTRRTLARLVEIASQRDGEEAAAEKSRPNSGGPRRDGPTRSSRRGMLD